MYTCSYSSNPIYLPFDASPSEHVNIFYFTLNYRDFANYRFLKLQISQTADFANYRFRKLQISQITDFANCRFRKLQISFRFVSFRFVNYSKPNFATSQIMPTSLLQVVNSLFQTCDNNWEQAMRTQLVDSL